MKWFTNTSNDSLIFVGGGLKKHKDKMSCLWFSQFIVGRKYKYCLDFEGDMVIIRREIAVMYLLQTKLFLFSTLLGSEVENSVTL